MAAPAHPLDELSIYGLPAVTALADVLFVTLWVTLALAGLAALLAPMALGARHRGLGDLAIWLPFAPFYYLLVSAAAWLAVVEYVRAPTQWNKTEHGLAKTSRKRRQAGSAAAPQLP